MVTLTRLTGMPFALNPDLIERVDETPDTVITLVDGAKYLVRESLADVVAAVTDYRARLLARVGSFETRRTLDGSELSVARRSRLSAVPVAEDAPPAPSHREG